MKKGEKMENNNSVRKIRVSKKEIREEKLENLNLVSRIFMKLYYGLEELIWLMVSVGIFVLFLELFSFFSF